MVEVVHQAFEAFTLNADEIFDRDLDILEVDVCGPRSPLAPHLHLARTEPVRTLNEQKRDSGSVSRFAGRPNGSCEVVAIDAVRNPLSASQNA